ncbi:MAG TPA: hypothetical protein DD638_03590 [Pasteurellaceae bacterium]|nr:hypothetical protein [Pasteurellaceae bacterium]
MKYIKWIIGLYLILPALSACLNPYAYGVKCFDGPQPVYCLYNGERRSYVSFFEKIEPSKHSTDSEQRWKDVSSCGGVDISKETNKFRIKGSRDEKGLVIIKVVRSFEQCMEDKGYKRLYHHFCGSQYPNWDDRNCDL